MTDNKYHARITSYIYSVWIPYIEPREVPGPLFRALHEPAGGDRRGAERRGAEGPAHQPAQVHGDRSRSGTYDPGWGGWLESRQRDTAPSEHTKSAITLLGKHFYNRTASVFPLPES